MSNQSSDIEHLINELEKYAKTQEMADLENLAMIAVFQDGKTKKAKAENSNSLFINLARAANLGS